MSTKLSLLSRAAVIAGILAIAGLPAFAQGGASTPAAAPNATAPAAPAAKPSAADRKTEPKVKKHSVAMDKAAATQKQTAPAPANKPAAPAKPDASK